MGKSSHVARRILAGVYPSQVAKELGRDFRSVERDIMAAVARGQLAFTDVLRTFPASVREETSPHYEQADYDGVPVLSIANWERFAASEIYANLREIERTLHNDFRRVLAEQFGSSEDGWWRTCVPEPIRQKCVTRREADQTGCDYHPWEYSMLLDLVAVAKKQYSTLSSHLDYLRSMDFGKFRSAMGRLNTVRNSVMHPVRLRIPDEESIDFVREMNRRFCSAR